MKGGARSTLTCGFFTLQFQLFQSLQQGKHRREVARGPVERVDWQHCYVCLGVKRWLYGKEGVGFV